MESHCSRQVIISLGKREMKYMFTLKHFFLTEVTPFEDYMFIEVGIVHAFDGAIQVETTIHFVEGEIENTEPMNLVH
jgi:hypothetical protein